MKFGMNLMKIREEIGITQTALAKELEISNSLYSRYERDEENIPIKTLIKISILFNVSIDYIFSFNNAKQYDNNSQNFDSKISGKRLKEFRKELKLSQTALAEELKTTYGTLSGYERGRYIIATPFLYDICKKYKISADYLLGKIDNPKYLK